MNPREFELLNLLSIPASKETVAKPIQQAQQLAADPNAPAVTDLLAVAAGTASEVISKTVNQYCADHQEYAAMLDLFKRFANEENIPEPPFQDSILEQMTVANLEIEPPIPKPYAEAPPGVIDQATDWTKPAYLGFAAAAVPLNGNDDEKIVPDESSPDESWSVPFPLNQATWLDETDAAKVATLRERTLKVQCQWFDQGENTRLEVCFLESLYLDETAGCAGELRSATGEVLSQAEQLTGEYPERHLRFSLPSLAGKPLASATWVLHATYQQPERYALQMTVSLADPDLG